MGVTEPYFVRIDSEVARLARATAEERQMPLRELTEKALRMYIAEVTEPGRRAAALHAMEEALLGRMDRRLAQHYERVAGLYAREAFDIAQTLDLVKTILWRDVRDDNLMAKYLNDSRAEATRILKQRAELPQPGTSAEEAIKKAKDQAAKLTTEVNRLNQTIKQLEQEKEALSKKASQMGAQAEQLEKKWVAEAAKAEETEGRYTWAIQQFEAQRGFSRRPIAEFLKLWDDQHGGF